MRVSLIDYLPTIIFILIFIFTIVAYEKGGVSKNLKNTLNSPIALRHQNGR